MATSWSGKLFVVALGNGKHQVGITMPMGEAAGCQVTEYDGQGPFPPTGFPQGKEVNDLSAWPSEKAQQGFTFTAV